MRLRGTGRVFKRGSAWWIAVCHQGKEVRESVAQALQRPVGAVTETEARALLQARLADIYRGEYVAPAAGRIEVRDLLDAYLTHLDLKGVARSTSTICVVRKVAAAVGSERAAGLTTARLERWAREELEAGKARGTVAHRLAILRAAFRLAHRQGRIRAVPCFPSIRVENARRGFFDPDEFGRLVAALSPEIADVARCAYLTGFRRSEVLGLAWAQVDRAGGLLRLEETKNGEKRSIPLVGALADLIEARWRARIVGTTLAPWVFHRAGRRISKFEKAWARACSVAGCTGRVFHDLRRTALRDMIRAGVHQHVAMRISGHKTESVFRRYNIVDDRDARAALGRVDDYRQSDSFRTAGGASEA